MKDAPLTSAQRREAAFWLSKAIYNYYMTVAPRELNANDIDALTLTGMAKVDELLAEHPAVKVEL